MTDQNGGINLNRTPIYVHAPTNCLYVIDGATGQQYWVVDYQTGQPMVSRQLYLEPGTGNLFAASLTGNGFVWVLDPLTGQHIARPDVLQEAQRMQAAQAASQPVGASRSVESARTVETSRPQEPARSQEPTQSWESMRSQEPFQAQNASQQAEPPQSAAAPWSQDLVQSQEALQSTESTQLMDSARSVETLQSQDLAQSGGGVQSQGVLQSTPPFQSAEVLQSQDLAQSRDGVQPQDTFQSTPPSQSAEELRSQDLAQSRGGAQSQEALQSSYTPQQSTSNLQAGEFQQQAASRQAMPFEQGETTQQETAQATSGEPASQPISTARAKMSALAIAALVLGVTAVAAAFIPVVNNGSLIVALVGFVCGVAGIVGSSKGKKRGFALAILGLVISIAAVVVALMTPNYFSSALNTVPGGAQHASAPVSATDGKDPGNPDASSDTRDYSSMSVGQSVTFDNGLTLSLVSVKAGIEGEGANPITGVTLSYTNNGTSNISYSPYDWKAQDADGALKNTTLFSKGEAVLESGELAPSDTVTGSVYFVGDIAKVFYCENGVLVEGSEIGWSVGK